MSIIAGTIAEAVAEDKGQLIVWHANRVAAVGALEVLSAVRAVP